MLIEFKVSNFRSYREEQTFSLVASNYEKGHPECVLSPNLPGLAGIKVLKGAAIYGANASGKSNILSAINFMGEYVQRSANRMGPNDPTGVVPFKLDDESKRRPTTFEMTFVTHGVRYVFGFSLNAERVVEEYLFAYPKGSPQRWYHRIFDEKLGRDVWAKSSGEFKGGAKLREATRPNALFVSVGAQFNNEQLTRVFEWFEDELRIVHFGADHKIFSNVTISNLGDPKCTDRIMGMIRNADVGITKVSIEEEEIAYDDLKENLPPVVFEQLDRLRESTGELPKRQKISFDHRATNGKVVPLRYEEQSSGTKRYFDLAGYWCDTLEGGLTVFVDEIDTSLHPLLVKALLELIFSEDDNLMGAQVVFTTHNPMLLDQNLIRRDQIWFAEKALDGCSHLYPLTEYQPRKGEALSKGYLGGRYGAIPSIPEGLLP